MTNKNLILAAAVAGMLAGVTGVSSANAEETTTTVTEGNAAPANAEKASCSSELMKNKDHKCGASLKKKKSSKMTPKNKEMGCKAGQCGSEMKKDEPASTPTSTPAAPAENK
jgi:hypothetical protein